MATPGGNARDQAAAARLAEANRSLPAGVSAIAVYDRVAATPAYREDVKAAAAEINSGTVYSIPN